MRSTVYNTVANARVAFPAEGTPMQVKLHGDDVWHDAVALDRPRKMWCRVMAGGPEIIADENSIEAWRVTSIDS